MNIFGGKAPTQAKSKPQYTGVQVQTSVLGTAIAVLLCGQQKIAPNLVWYDDFKAIEHKAKQAGKGGGAASASSTYTYQAAVAMGLCGTEIASIGRVWKSKNSTTLAKEGMALFKGAPGQAPWGYLATKHPDKALAYQTLAYVAAGPLDLGDSADISNYNFEVMSTIGNAIAGLPDGDPKDAIMRLLPNSDFGPNFPAARIGDLSVYSNYCRAVGLVVSPLLTSQQQCSQFLSDLVSLTNSEVVWNGSQFTIVPYGDTTISANGATYNAPSAPLFDLTDDDFLPSDGEPPVTITCKRPADAYNKVTIEFLDRANAYNTDQAESKGQAEIDLYGVVPDDGQQAHFFCDRGVATKAAELRRLRQYVLNTYQFKLGIQWLFLDPMDIVTITNARLGLFRQWVRIKEIEKDEDDVLTVTAEEYLGGTGAAPQYGLPAAARYQPNYNQVPALCNPPVIFEPNLSLSETGSLEVWAAVSGSDAIWGGCDVWVSDDGDTYRLATTVHGNSRYGILSAALATIPASPDQVNTLSVDLSVSGAELSSGTTQDAGNLNTLCYVDGEYIAYATATLTGASKYDLTYLVRGAMGTTIGAHAAGSNFIRLDDSVVKVPVDQNRIGQTIYLKFVGFNATNGGFQDISEVPAYSYVIGGSALLGPLANPANVTTNYISNILQIRWDPISDLRQPIDYEIRRGPAFSNSMVMGRTTGASFPAAGAGTYWVAAHYQTTDGLDVYSGNPVSIIIAGGSLVNNVIATWDEAATGWAGTVSGGAALADGAIRLYGGGNILAEPDFLGIADVLNYGGIAASGIYTAPDAHTITMSRAAPCAVSMTWLVYGQSIHDNVLNVPDFLGMQDVLGSEFNPLVKAVPQIALSQDGVTFGDWQAFYPGVYTFLAIKARMVLMSTRNDVIAILSAWSFSVDVEDRVDVIPLTTSSSAPLGYSYPQPFNGGANGNPAPFPEVTILNAQDGDQAVVGSQTVNGFTYAVTNAGAYVVRSIIVTAQGY